MTRQGYFFRGSLGDCELFCRETVERWHNYYRLQSSTYRQLHQRNTTYVTHYFMVTVKISRSTAITDLIVTRAASAIAELCVSVFAKMAILRGIHSTLL